MARKLTEVEVFYIQNNTNQTADQLSKSIKGVGVTAIQEVLNNTTVPSQQDAKPAKVNESIFKGKTDEEVKAIIHNPDEHKVYNNFARADGVTVMTQAASELSDARKVLKVNQPNAKEQKDKIHVIHQNRPTR